jgi:hypothetical protein
MLGQERDPRRVDPSLGRGFGGRRHTTPKRNPE